MDQNETNTGTCLDCGQPTKWPSANRCAACAQTILDSIWVPPEPQPEHLNVEKTAKVEHNQDTQQHTETTDAPPAPSITDGQHEEKDHNTGQETPTPTEPDIPPNSETQQEPKPTEKPVKTKQKPTEKEPARLEDLPLFR